MILNKLWLKLFLNGIFKCLIVNYLGIVGFFKKLELKRMKLRVRKREMEGNGVLETEEINLNEAGV